MEYTEGWAAGIKVWKSGMSLCGAGQSLVAGCYEGVKRSWDFSLNNTISYLKRLEYGVTPLGEHIFSNWGYWDASEVQYIAYTAKFH